MTSDKRPTPIVKLDRGRLLPVSGYDADELAGYPQGQEFDLKPRGKRSQPHHRMYWWQLAQIVKATEAFATSEHMHKWAKITLGYVEPVLGPKGQVVGTSVDSTDFESMDQAQFRVYYERFTRLVAEEMGIDLGAM